MTVVKLYPMYSRTTVCFVESAVTEMMAVF